jgi:hypothetical protein
MACHRLHKLLRVILRHGFQNPCNLCNLWQNFCCEAATLVALHYFYSMKQTLTFCLFTFAFCLFLSSCKKDSFITSPNARLYITADTIKFDTVFTTTGSITKQFKIINQNEQKLRFDKIKLMGGTSSAYKININGVAAAEQNNIEVAANDSIYVFVTVTINPTAANLPFIISDSILVQYNSNNRYVQLQSYGQNANFLSSTVITGNVTWNNTKPYVILGGLQIANGASLTIPQGCKIYAHADAPFLVDGTLTVTGTKAAPVIFTGDRLDYYYKDLPASWPGIYFRSTSKDNVLQFAQIKNAYQAVVSIGASVNANPKLILHQCIIDNAYDAGILTVGSSLQADNSLISNCGSNIAITYGGNYSFTHCTAATFSNSYITHKNPVLSVNNFASQNGSTVTADLNATFRNCIFWADTGFVNNEVVVAKQGSNAFTVLFDKNIYRGNDPANSTLNNNIRNIYPQFDSIDVTKKYYDFRITNTTAPGVNKGAISSFLKDLDDKNRNVSLPDIGCYEKQ